MSAFCFKDVSMDKIIYWLVYLLAGAFVIAMAGAGIGLFLGVAWKAFRWVIG